MSQTKEKIKIFSKFRPFVHSGEIDVHSNFVCSLYSDSNKRLRDILENKQLYAPNFTTFNDAREGWFNAIYKQGISIKEVLDNMYERKLEKNICCFSEKFDDFEKNGKYRNHELLMWAHYANSHLGLRIDFSVKEVFRRKYVKKVRYCQKTKDINIYEGKSYFHSEENIIDILTRKDNVWKYEHEYRAILDNVCNNVDIDIERIVLGRGFLPRINYGENNIACNLKCLINAIKHILNDDKIKISIYKSRYDDELIDI